MRNRTLQMARTSLEAKRVMDRQRIPSPRMPDDDYPPLPDDPTDLGDSELMSLFVTLTKWAEFLSTQLAMAEVDERYADEYLERFKAIKTLSNANEKTVTLMKAKAWEDPEFQEAHDNSMKAYAYRKLIKVKFENAERNSSMLSRELTRRVARHDREERADRGPLPKPKERY